MVMKSWFDTFVCDRSLARAKPAYYCHLDFVTNIDLGKDLCV